ncbi:MAG: DUF374 domain-containing protein [Cytophagaceae bacterium]|nr:MAG: DUF374 domain-containing protein [Cytophagaceae bacterium]
MKLRDAFWTTQQPYASIRSWTIPRLLRLLHSALMSTLRFSTSGVYRMQPFIETPDRGALFVIWHDQTLVPLHLFRDCGIATMMSRSRAGQMQAGFWRLYGWPIIWGSTKKKEGIAALRETLRHVSGGGVAGFTPDGPKGPRRQAHGGVVYLASKSGVPVLPLGVAASDFWQLKTWDRYLIPKPFARIHVHTGEPLFIPSNLNREESEMWKVKVKNAMDEAEQKAIEALERHPR